MVDMEIEEGQEGGKHQNLVINACNHFWNVTYIILRFCSTSVWILFPQWDVSGFLTTSSVQCAERGSLDYFFYQVVNLVTFF